MIDVKEFDEIISIAKEEIKYSGKSHINKIIELESDVLMKELRAIEKNRRKQEEAEKLKEKLRHLSFFGFYITQRLSEDENLFY